MSQAVYTGGAPCFSPPPWGGLILLSLFLHKLLTMDSDNESIGSPVPPPYSEAPQSGNMLGSAEASSPRATRSPSPNSVRLARIAAMERRNAEILAAQRAEAEAIIAPTFDAFDEDYEKRTEFRRMIEPGIMRPNTREVAMRSLKVCVLYLCVSVNILTVERVRLCLHWRRTLYAALFSSIPFPHTPHHS